MNEPATTTPKQAHILIVDDDDSVTASLSFLMKQAGYRPHTASSPREALSLAETVDIDLVIQDMNFSRKTTGEEGLALLAELVTAFPHMPVVLITAWGSIALAVKGIKAGAFDFVTKPWDNDQILRVVNTALSLSSTREEAGLSREELDNRYDFSAIIGSDPALLNILETVGRVGATDASVLILGESGTGKELIAEALHHNSKRNAAPFVKVNLGGISASLFESEMFGHVRGAFTDAVQERRGRFARAHGGSIFLDEIGDLDHACQVKMLRVLQDRKFEPLGSSRALNVDVRVIAATNRDLGRMVRSGEFREDLLYRLNLITLRLPPLRERPGDIPPLARQKLSQVAQTYGMDACAITEEAMAWLQSLDWPGNIRQLYQTVERAVLMSGKVTLARDDFIHPDLSSGQPKKSDLLPPVGKMTLDEIEKAMVIKSLAHFDGNITKVANALGLSRAALYRRMEKFGIEP